jgi:hypothetical protein
MKYAVLKRASRYKRLLTAGTVLTVLGLGLMGLAAPAMAATSCSATWTGNAGNGLWTTAANWSPEKVPGPTSNVCIPILTTANATGPISVNSIQVAEGGSLLLGSGSFSVATSINDQGFIQMTGTTLSAASITLPSLGNITAYGNSSITSPAFSNTGEGDVAVGADGTLRLADNPVQLQNGVLNGGNWDISGVLVVPSDISQITTSGTTLSLDGEGTAVQDSSGNNALATLTTTGSGTALGLFDDASLTVAQSLTSQGAVDVGSGIGGSLTVNGTYTAAAGGTTGLSVGTLTATSVSVQPGGSLGGQGTVTGPVTNNGTVAPNDLTVAGNYTQTASATLTEVFTETLIVTGNATLSGALNVTVNPKHPPAQGAVYTALTFGSLTGAFTSVTAGYTLTTNATNIQVTNQ